MMKSALNHGLAIILAALFLLASRVSSFSQYQSILHHSRKSSLTSSFMLNNVRISWPCFPAVNSFPTTLRISNGDEPDFKSSPDNDDNDEFGNASSSTDYYNNLENEATEASIAQSLSERIAQIQQSESEFVSGLQRRVQRVAKAEELDMAMSYERKNDETTESPYGENLEKDPSNSSRRNNNSIIVSLPVIAFDALLPNQRLQGSTTDPTFCNFLRSMGLGGSFVMTSVNTRQRKIRRFGVVAKIELVDVEGDDIHEVGVDIDNGDGKNDAATSSKYDDDEKEFSLGGLLSFPTAVTFSIVGARRCEILGPVNGMQSRIGRWRRGYDPDGEESRLGWGDERFVDRVEELTLQPPEFGVSNKNSEPLTRQSTDVTEWTNNQILIIDESSEDIHATTSAIGNATHTILPLITQWLSLASNPQTYDNTNVVASTRRKSGEPGLVVNPTALLKKVQEELGPMPPPERPTALAVWGAGLLNPLPALGVAPEVRGAVLEAHGAEGKLKVLERGLWRSIGNLDGSRPLGM